MRPKVPMRQPESHCSIVAKKRSNVRGAKGAGHPRQGGVNGKPEELLVLAEAGRLPWGGTSRMNREIHVRICGRLGVKFPGPTRRDPQRAMVALLGHEAGNGGYSQRKPTAPGSPLLGATPGIIMSTKTNQIATRAKPINRDNFRIPFAMTDTSSSTTLYVIKLGTR